MKTCQSTGYFQRVSVYLLLCFISSVVFAGSTYAFTAPNSIDQCYDCHGSPTIPGGNDLRPVDATYRNITTGGFVGNHRTHMPAVPSATNLSCVPCHGPAQTKMDHRSSTGVINMRLHINSTATVRGYYDKPVGKPAAFFNQTSAPVMSTCNNVNCHFRTTSPAWGATPLTGGQTVANCQICHLSTGMNTGDHTKHIAAFGNTITTCSKCHPDNTTFTHATSAKFGRSITVTLAGAPFATGTYAASTHAAYPNYFTATGYGSCNNAYCHSSVQSATGGAPPVYKQVTWGLTSLTCSGCHGNTAATLVSGSHSSHLLATYAFVCTDCHGTIGGAGNTDIHANGSINVDLTNRGTNGTYLGDSIPQNSNFNACNNTNCHGRNSAVWGTAGPTNGVCTTCHGQLNYAYTNFSASQIAPGGSGVDTGGLSAATDPRVGTHQNHLTGAMGISAPVHCGECHIVQTAVIGGTHLGYTTARVSFGAIAKSNSHTAATTTRTSGIINCSTTHCHSGKLNSGAAQTPAWNNTSYLTGAGGAAAIVMADCKQCHGMPPTPGAGAHSSVPTALTAFPATTCGCHANLSKTGTTYANVFVDKTIHINGTIDVSACDSCHSFPPTSGAHTKHINKILSLEGLASAPSGFVNNTVCGSCHNDSSSTLHKGDNSAATTRNIYYPTATTYQIATYQFGTNPPAYDKVATTCSNLTCHLGVATPAWGTTAATCNGCHGYPPVTTVSDPDNKHAGTVPVNHIGTIALKSDTKELFVSAHGGCQICHGTMDSGSGTHSAHANYNVLTQHDTGSLNMNGPTTAPIATSTQYDSVTRGCNNACHINGSPYRMTTSTSLPLVYGEYGAGSNDCTATICHGSSSPLASPKALSLGGPATRRAVVVEMKNTWSHKRSSAGGTPANTVVTKDDCIVCHMEGVKGGGTSGVHKDGYIDLRDPDTGLQINAVTWNSATPGAYVETSNTPLKFLQFSRDLSVRLELDPHWLEVAAVQINHCLKCHDANGAVNVNAQSTASGTAMRPFGVAIIGHTAPLNSNGSGNVVNVAKSFVSTNGAYHPVASKANNSYTQGTKMVAPWNGVTKTNGNNTSYGALMSCWDCHAPAGTSGAQVSTVTAHGAPATLRAPIRTGGATAALNLCIVCHATTYATTGNNHGTGSAFGAGGSSMSSNSTFVNCFYCHGYNGAVGATVAAASTRPNRAEDVHGTDDRTAGTAASRWTSGAKPFAFIRNTLSDWRPASATGVTFGGSLTSSQCLGTGGTCNNNMSSRTYTPGGAY